MNYQRLNIVKELVREASLIAMRHFGRAEARRKKDHSPVTDADIEVGDFLTRRLKLNFPDYGIINEESVFNDPELFDKHEYVWILDPIDGTSSFSSKLPIWGIVVGLMRKGEPVLGVVYLPVMDELYYTDEDCCSMFESSRWGSHKMSVSESREPFDRESLLLTVSYAHRRLNISFPGKVRALGSTAAHICYVARGDAELTITKGEIWDIIPAWAILKNAGGAAHYLDGSKVVFSDIAYEKFRNDFMVFGSGANLDKILGNVFLKQ
jgi:myo-inositol-1(or 4)-monophosphatase